MGEFPRWERHRDFRGCLTCPDARRRGAAHSRLARGFPRHSLLSAFSADERTWHFAADYEIDQEGAIVK